MNETIFLLQSELRKQQIEARKELLEKGPFNLIFHGVEPDWVEQEMADDPEFRRDVVEHRIKTLIREGVRKSICTFLVCEYFWNIRED